MSGLYDRIAMRGEGAAPISAHLLKAAMYLAVRGVFTTQQIVTALNAKLSTPLSGADTADLAAIYAQANTGTATAKLDYLERFDALNIAVEMGVLTSEAVWRAQLGI